MQDAYGWGAEGKEPALSQDVPTPIGPDPSDVDAQRRQARERAFAHAQGLGQTPEEQRQAMKKTRAPRARRPDAALEMCAGPAWSASQDSQPLRGPSATTPAREA